MDRIIWMLWFQGFDKAPVLVRHCMESWKRHHPEWTCIVLDDSNLKDYIDVESTMALNHKRITKQAKANLVRLELLHRYGGVWADATCYCMKPLDEWLPSIEASGFFAFRNPGPDRLLSNWFLAAEKGSYIIAKLKEVSEKYWTRHSFTGMQYPMIKMIRRRLQKYARKSMGRINIWFSPVVLNILRIYPLFWFHYLFARLVKSDSRFRRQWEDVAFLEAKPIHLIQQYGQEQIPDAQICARIESRLDPMYKLSWKKISSDKIEAGTVLEYLLRQ
jgi:hypothetical protein